MGLSEIVPVPSCAAAILRAGRAAAFLAFPAKPNDPFPNQCAVASLVQAASNPSGPVRTTVTQAPRRSAMATSAAESSVEYIPSPTRPVDLRQSAIAPSRSAPMSVPGTAVHVANAGSPPPVSEGRTINPAVTAATRPPRVAARRRRLVLSLAGPWPTPDRLGTADIGSELSMRLRSDCARARFGCELCSAASRERSSVSRFWSIFIVLTPSQVMPRKYRQHGGGDGRGEAARHVWHGLISSRKATGEIPRTLAACGAEDFQKRRVPRLLDELLKEGAMLGPNRCDC